MTRMLTSWQRLPKALTIWRRLPQAMQDAAWYGASLGWTKALAMLTLPFLTAYLMPADFARIELLSSAAEIAALFACAGLVDTAYRFAGAGGEAGGRAAGEILGLALVLAATGLGLTWLLAPHIAAHMPLAVRPREILLLGIAVSLESLIAVPMAMLRITGRAGRYALTASARATLQSGLVVVLLVSGFGVAGVLGAGAIAAVSAAVVLTAAQRRETGLRVQPAQWGRLLAYGVPLIGSGLASFVLGTADRWLLAGHVSAQSLGHYALAAKISLIAALLTQPFELWWYPRRLAVLAAAGGAARSARIASAGLVLTMLAAAATACAGPILIRALTPVSYHAAIIYVPLLAACLALQSAGSLVNVGCYARRTGMVPMAINGAAAVVALAGYVLFIPHHGIDGAIGATLAAQSVRLVLFYGVAQRLVALPWRFAPLVAPAGFSVASAMAAQSHLPVASALAIASALWLAALGCAWAGGVLGSGAGPTAGAVNPAAI